MSPQKSLFLILEQEFIVKIIIKMSLKLMILRKNIEYFITSYWNLGCKLLWVLNLNLEIQYEMKKRSLYGGLGVIC